MEDRESDFVETDSDREPKRDAVNAFERGADLDRNPIQGAGERAENPVHRHRGARRSTGKASVMRAALFASSKAPPTPCKRQNQNLHGA